MSIRCVSGLGAHPPLFHLDRCREDAAAVARFLDVGKRERQPALDRTHGHLSEEPVSLHEADEDVSKEMDRIVLKLLAKDPDDRYQSPKHLIGDLEHYVQALRQAASGHQIRGRPRTRRRRR